MPVEVYNHQDAEAVSEALLEKLTDAANLAMPLALQNLANGGGVLKDGLEVEISIVDDETITQVHVDFMGIPGATDVITFSHDEVGEIVISSETAKSYGAEYGNSFETELMLYIIHGLLHLAGHEDEDSTERAAMEKIQFAILKKVWED